MKARSFNQIRIDLGMSKGQFADALEISTTTEQAYRSGKHKIPKIVAMACKWLQYEHYLQKPMKEFLVKTKETDHG